MSIFGKDEFKNNFSYSNDIPIEHGIEDMVKTGKDKVDYEYLVNEFFDMFSLYLNNMSESKKTKFMNRVYKSFYLRFNCDFDERVILVNIPYKPELRDFFIQRFEFINDFHNGFLYLNDEDYLERAFIKTNLSVKEIEFDTPVSRSINSYLPNYASRYNINDIISQFAHDIINKKDVNINDRYKYSKKLILSFIYLCVFTQFNKNYSINVDGVDISFQDYLKSNFTDIQKTVVRRGSIDTTVESGNNIIKALDTISDSFAHASGNLMYIHSENKIQFKNRFDTTFELNVDNFINGMSNLFDTHLVSLLPDSFNGTLSDVLDNGSMNVLLSLIDKITNNKFNDINNNEIMFLMGYLQLCFNQEGLLDTEIMSQYSLIDCTDFELEYGFDIDQHEASTIELFKTHHLVFTDKNSSNKMNGFWSNYISDFNSSEDKKSGTLCDVSKMVYDSTNDTYIPSSEVIIHLRNSLRHGRYKIDGDRIHFWDQKNSNDSVRPNQIYFHLSIDCDKFLNFLSDNIINEVLYIEFSDLYKNVGTVKEFKGNRTFNKLFFYESEMAYSKNGFKNYMDILKTRFYDFELSEFVDCLIEQNLISRYLADNIDRYDEFLEYEITDGVKLVDYLKQKYNFEFKAVDDNQANVEELIDSLVGEMRSLIDFELDSINSNESVFFKYYFEYFYKKANIFKNDFELPKEIKDKIMVAKMDSKYLLGGINYDKKYTRNFLLNLALFKHNEFDEFERLDILRINSLYLKRDYGEELPLSFSYENVIKRTDDKDMFMDSVANVVCKTRNNSVFRKGLSAFKSIIGTSLVSSTYILTSLGSSSFLNPSGCIFSASVLAYLGVMEYTKYKESLNDAYRVINSRATEKYILDVLECDDLFQRQVRRGKR